ncbi:MAG TPA: fumarylacetoacetate hydrolase family protein [Enteractinococcus helveticum]|uniref:Fumarylacetoacetate hydrolase family protein n=1 Tax=Enteractinococcus helveticum TaxID=1837282 RepID=A0A921K8H1_9MICC|nr:fumarylacetoacetate hydrolase family protein [Enteractinococcus helveticum]HJF13929.1 fumarylacetoacetate hydrolase family protein [Enteractinococcus helveticum]
MRIARFVHRDDFHYGVVENDTITVLANDPMYAGIVPTTQTLKFDDVRLVTPILPRSKVVGVGRNWQAHAEELGNEVPTSPLLFFKPNTSVVGTDEPVMLPDWTEEVSYEAELAVIIGRIAKDVPIDRVDEVIFGYTVGNDLTARDVQRVEDQWARAKGFDGSCPLGPWIETELDPDNVQIRSWVDGELRQNGNTQDMIFDVRTLVSYISEAFTLLPGDVILTGTPAGVGTIYDGQTVECEIQDIGTLSTTVRRPTVG